MISEDMVPLAEETLITKKDGAYPIARVNVGMMKRYDTFLEDGINESTKSIGLPSAHCHAKTSKIANKCLAPLITDTTKGNWI